MVLPSGTLTFLITDVEESTRLWDEHPDAMSEAMAWHDTLLAGVIGRRDGHVVKSTGDGVLAVFTSVDAAVGAAVDAQLELAERRFGPVGVLGVRAGLNTGEAFARDGDYFGSAVNRTARIAAGAVGGQIVLSDTTALLARTAGWETVELGTVQLRGLAEPERIHQVTAPGLRRDFPPVSAAAGFRHNLPATMTDFIGRSRDVAHVGALLGGGRLVTITGPGGIGKTRLALEVAARIGAGYGDGVWFVDLSPAKDADEAAEAAAVVLGVAEVPGRSLPEGIAAYLEGRATLLVLDNCEQVLDAAREMTERWLPAAPALRILATSRQRLGAAGEAVWPLGPLGPEPALGDAAVQLFVARAEAVNPHLDIAGHGDAIARLCRDLDGIPLAIELAAARTSALTPAQIHERLDSQSRILRRRDDPHRHGSLRAAIEWSYELLAPGEARMFAALAVYGSGFDLAAAEAMAGVADLDRLDVVDVLQSLVEKSLLVTETGGRVARYRYLEPLRQFAMAQLREAGREAVAMDALTRWAHDLVGEELPVLETDRRMWESRVRERHNLDQALGWMVERGDAAGAARLAAGLNSVWQWLAYQDGLDWYRRILAMPGLVPADRVVMLCGAAWLEWSFGKPPAAIGMVADAQELADRHELELPLQGVALRAVIASFDDQPEAALRLAMEALERAAGTHDGAEVAAAEIALVWAYAGVGRFAEAAGVAGRVLEFARGSGNDSALTTALMGLAVAERGRDAARALELLDEAVALAGESGARWHLAAATLHRGYTWMLRGEITASLEEFTRAVRLAVDIEDYRAAGSAMEAIASRAAGEDPAAAVRVFAGAAQLRRELAGVAGLRVETAHRRRVLERLRAEHGDEFSRWWEEGSRLDVDGLAAAAEELGRRLAAGAGSAAR